MIGERIEQARLAAGLSMRALSGLIGVSPMAISKYERGLINPSSSVLLALSKALGVKVEYFFRTVNVELHSVEYRKHSTLSGKQLKRVEGDVVEQVERYLELVEIFPQMSPSSFSISKNIPSEITSLEQIEEVSEAIRKEWKLGLNPIPDLMNTMEENGIRVFLSDIDEEMKFDGLAAKINDSPIIVVSKNWPGDRQRFTLAHELGHLVMNGRIAAGIDEEKAANRFAGSFLAPRKEAILRLGQRRDHLEAYELACLKKEYGLSMNAWVYRAKDLNIINDACFKSTMAYFGIRGWRKTEPYEEYPKERPYLFEQMVFRALGQDLISESKAAELLRLPLPEFRRKRAVESDAATH